VTETLEHTARRIAERGRDTLVARLRPAFEEAAASHSDVLQLDEQQLERMVQRAADRADGLQWRRALAAVATEELGITLGEALGHPAVARAQAIVGAPSYEESLARIAPAEPVAASGAPAEPEGAAGEPDGGAGEPEGAAGEPDGGAGAREGGAGAREGAAGEPEGAEDTAPHPVVPAHEDVPLPGVSPFEPIRIPAVHVGGEPGLGEGQAELELRFTDHGLQILRDADEATLARIAWQDLRGLRVQIAKGRRLRRRAAEALLVVEAAAGGARFLVPGVTPDELRRHIIPARARL
jgi:hypothetical protein